MKERLKQWVKERIAWMEWRKKTHNCYREMARKQRAGEGVCHGRCVNQSKKKANTRCMNCYYFIGFKEQ